MITYDFKDRIYNVNGSSVFHQRLQGGKNFISVHYILGLVLLIYQYFQIQDSV